jgi:hypothetical protein
MRLDDFFGPGRVVHRAQLSAQARPYGLFFGPGRHDAEDGPMGHGRAGTILQLAEADWWRQVPRAPAPAESSAPR